jgi:hypothetical protein
MCFSTTASFTLSTVLVSTGFFSVFTAYKLNKHYLLIALMPIILGLQQGFEGIIWWSFRSGNYLNIHFYTYLYLFFAFYFWPSYIPISVYLTEKNSSRKKILMGFIIAGQMLGIILYLPLLFNIIPVSTHIIKHSIHYATYQSAPVLWIYSIGYIGLLTIPLFLSSSLPIRFFGLMVLLSSLIAYWLYLYVFTSMWCFFAAVLSIYIAYIIIQLPKKQVKNTG